MGRRKFTYGLYVAVILVLAVMLRGVSVSAENNTKTVESEATEAWKTGMKDDESYRPAEDEESMYRHMVAEKERYEAAEKAAGEKYGESYVTVTRNINPQTTFRAVLPVSAGERIYSQVLKNNVVGITIVEYYAGGGYDVKLNWNEGILGASTGKRLYCADPVKGFQEGYKTAVPGTDYFSEYTIDFLAAVFYYCDHYLCDGLSEDQDYIMKQIAFWHFANFLTKWFPNCYFDFSAHYYCGCGKDLFDHRVEILEKEGFEWANENYDKMDAEMTVYEGGGQPLMELNYEYNPGGKMRLKKVSADPEITGGSLCYSLAGAEYGVYRDKACTDLVTTLITDENGNSGETEIDAGTWYIRERKAPEGYVMNTQIYEVEVLPGQTAVAEVSDQPVMAPVDLLLQKKDAETEEACPQGKGSLGGAQFEVCFYKMVSDTDPAKEDKTPERTWVMETEKDGTCTMTEDNRISGDAFYLNEEGVPAFPLGTVTIREIQAPEGYLLNPEVYVIPISPEEGGNGTVQLYVPAEVPENVLKLELLKLLKDTEQVIPGAVFRHIFPDGSEEQFITDRDGKAVLKGLTWGTHIIEEVSVPDGISRNPGSITFTVGKDNKIAVTSNTSVEEEGMITLNVNSDGNISVTVEDVLAPYELEVCKENEKQKKLEGAEFSLYADRECTAELQKGKSDKEGRISFKDLKVETKYYLKETKAPEGYRIPETEDGRTAVYEIYTRSNPVEGVFEYYVDGEMRTEISGTKAERKVGLKIVNQTGKKLPETGTAAILTIFLTGTAIMAAAMIAAGVLKRKENKNENGRKGKV